MKNMIFFEFGSTKMDKSGWISSSIFYFDSSSLDFIKFIYSEKATKYMNFKTSKFPFKNMVNSRQKSP